MITDPSRFRHPEAGRLWPDVGIQGHKIDPAYSPWIATVALLPRNDGVLLCAKKLLRFFVKGLA